MISLMADLQDMLDAHVRFELARWQGEALGATIVGEVDAAYRFLGTVTFAELLDPEAVAESAVAALCRLELDAAQLADVAGAAVDAARGYAQGSDATLADVVSHDRFTEVATAAIGLTGVRAEAIAQISPASAETVTCREVALLCGASWRASCTESCEPYQYAFFLCPASSTPSSSTPRKARSICSSLRRLRRKRKHDTRDVTCCAVQVARCDAPTAILLPVVWRRRRARGPHVAARTAVV